MEQKVRFLDNFSEMKLVGRTLGPFNEGEEASLRAFEASVLEDRGMVEPVEDFSLVGLRKRLMSEEKSSELGELPTNFYLAVSQEIEKLNDKGNFEEAGKMRETMESLVRIRVRKLADMAVSPAEIKDLPLEERFLANRLSRAFEIWRNRLDQLFEKSPNEEVGAREKRFRRSVQGVVGNSTDIQE